MTTSTTNTTTTANTNSTQEAPIMNTQDINTNALSSVLAANLFHKLGNTQSAVLVACAITDSIDQEEYFADMLVGTLNEAVLNVRAKNVQGTYETNAIEVELDVEAIATALEELDYIAEDGSMGEALVELISQRSEAYAPTTGPIERRFISHKLEKGQVSPLVVEAIHALEATKFTVDPFILEVANKVQTLTGGAKKDDEAHVLAGCNNMDSTLAYSSEFMADRRARLYQAACHGPNGQSSDRSRALMDLAGVTTDYNVEVVKKAIRAEIMDMINIPANQVGILMRKAITNPVEFVVGELAKAKKERDAAKPWSFLKAAMIWSELVKGNKPYIGMAVGLDAKCSGPQLGAMMAGDANVAAACGMTLSEMDDAYEIAIQELNKAGLLGFSRGGVKKSYMGIFYGQGWEAFTDVDNLLKAEQFEVVEILFPTGVVTDGPAKAFHKAISKSFGTKMSALRERFKAFGGKLAGRVGHTMPCGFKVQMNYKIKFNIHNMAMEHGVDADDVTVETPNNTYKFIKFQLKTLEVHTGDFARNGFVNMIQATDALIARLIIVHLNRLGAQHIISVHDCFRVNVTEMHLLEEAIRLAYLDLFGSETNTKTKDLPMGTDILAMYFEGANKACVEGESVQSINQFFKVGAREVRTMRKINGVKTSDIINQLDTGNGGSYYFAK